MAGEVDWDVRLSEAFGDVYSIDLVRLTCHLRALFWSLSQSHTEGGNCSLGVKLNFLSYEN